MLFAPQRMANGDLYTTGATHDPTGLQAIWLNHRDDLDAVIMLDPMARAIWREPTNIHDAFQLMLMNPIIALQVLISTLYAKTELLGSENSPRGRKSGCRSCITCRSRISIKNIIPAC